MSDLPNPLMFLYVFLKLELKAKCCKYVVTFKVQMSKREKEMILKFSSLKIIIFEVAKSPKIFWFLFELVFVHENKLI